MNIILVSNRLTRTVHLKSQPFVIGTAFMALVIVAAAFGLGCLLGANTNGSPMQLLKPAQPSAKQAEIDALAIKLGELQAKLLRLDGFAKRVGNKTGIDATPFLSAQAAPRGGPLMPGAALSPSLLKEQIHQTELLLDAYQDQLSLAEAALLLPSMDNLPVHSPVPSTQIRSSSFGARIDPINGHQTFHEGVDFQGDIGTPIKAAGSGTVIFAAAHPEYGNMVELDHGNGLTSRYAHNSKLNVREGDKVSAGQVISFLGNSGRSTGPHMHFEIRYKNVPQNPLRFLTSDPEIDKKVATAR